MSVEHLSCANASCLNNSETDVSEQTKDLEVAPKLRFQGNSSKALTPDESVTPAFRIELALSYTVLGILLIALFLFSFLWRHFRLMRVKSYRQSVQLVQRPHKPRLRMLYQRPRAAKRAARGTTLKPDNPFSEQRSARAASVDEAAELCLTVGDNRRQQPGRTGSARFDQLVVTIDESGNAHVDTPLRTSSPRTPRRAPLSRCVDQRLRLSTSLEELQPLVDIAAPGDTQRATRCRLDDADRTSGMPYSIGRFLRLRSIDQLASFASDWRQTDV